MSDVRVLRRVLGPWSVVAFGVTNQIGAGLFFVSTQVQQTAPGTGDLVPWLMVVVVYGFGTSPQAFTTALTSHLHLSAAAITAQPPVHRVDWAAAFGTALPVLFFAYLGLSTATQTGDEAIDARRTLGRGVLIAV